MNLSTALGPFLLAHFAFMGVLVIRNLLGRFAGV